MTNLAVKLKIIGSGVRSRDAILLSMLETRYKELMNTLPGYQPQELKQGKLAELIWIK